MNCRDRKEFELKALSKDIEDSDVSSTDESLLKFLKRMNADKMLQDARDLYYCEGVNGYEEWLEDEMNSRRFWEDIKDAIEEKERDGELSLSPDDKEALNDACLGQTGREIFAFAMAWFSENGFIRSDMTVWKCRAFRYLDSYLMTRRNIMTEIFNRYETMDDIEEIRKRTMDRIAGIVNDIGFRLLENQIDSDEKYFESKGDLVKPTGRDKDILDVAHKILRLHGEEIYEKIFK